jgi:hypothetical protein
MNDGIVVESDMVANLGVSAIKLRKVLQGNKDIFQYYRSGLDRKLYVTLQKEYINSSNCAGCKFLKIEKDIKKCTSSVTCRYDWVRKVSELIKLAQKELDLSIFNAAEEISPNSSGHILENKVTDKNVRYWKIGDFRSFIKEMYEPYSHFIDAKAHRIMRIVGQLVKIFQVEYPDRWQYVLKRYIRWTFALCEENSKIPSLIRMSDKAEIQKFVDADRSTEYLFCREHGIYCPYYGSKQCTLTISCSKELRKKMIGKFN